MKSASQQCDRLYLLPKDMGSDNLSVFHVCGFVQVRDRKVDDFANLLTNATIVPCSVLYIFNRCVFKHN